MAQIGEVITGRETIGTTSATNITVPNGEVWKFTTISSWNDTQGFSETRCKAGPIRNDGTEFAYCIGGGQTGGIISGGGLAITGDDFVDAEGTGNHYVIDGNNFNLRIRNTDQDNQFTVHWEAVRVDASDGVISNIEGFFDSGNNPHTIGFPNDDYRVVTFSVAQATNPNDSETGPLNDGPSIGRYDGSTHRTPIVSPYRSYPLVGGGVNHLTIPSSDDLTFNASFDNNKIYYCAIKV
jgi:hypothetical protein